MDEVIVISVVRDAAMYERCVAGNPMTSGCRLVPIDNTVKNDGIPMCYNRVIDGLLANRHSWLVFCHEDFQPLEHLADALSRANRNCLYGPVGGILECRRPWLLGGMWPGVIQGIIETNEKDGSKAGLFGVPVPVGTQVDTVDCQCLIVHSSLVERYHLRFDEHLTFDLYTEDLCLGAQLVHGVKTAILPFRCRHHSRGNVLPRFFEQKNYLDAKYPKAEAFGCVGYTIGGGRTWVRRLQKRFRKFLDAKMPWAVSLAFRLLNI